MSVEDASKGNFPLQNIRVLEFVGTLSSTFCGKILSDFGATITRIDRVHDNPLDCLRHNKNTLVLNIKDNQAQNLIKLLCTKYDVLIDSFRPGVLEKHNLGPDVLLKLNPRLIYARLTGFGQNGPLSSRSGHDINFLATSGVYSMLCGSDRKITRPMTCFTGLASGGLLATTGICLALLERYQSGRGQIVDNSMAEGNAYIASWLTIARKLPFWLEFQDENTGNDGKFYFDTYETKDGKMMSVAAYEAHLYAKFVETLSLNHLKQTENNLVGKKLVADKFLTKTQEEWIDTFRAVDACVFPVVDWMNASEYEHNNCRESFDENGTPRPAPRLSRSPVKLERQVEEMSSFEQAVNVLEDIGMNVSDVEKLIADGVIDASIHNKL